MESRSAPNIWQLQAQHNIAGIIQALDTRDPSVRRRAIGALKALDAKEAIPRLKALHDTEFNPEMRELIESTLQHLSRNIEKAPEKTQEEHKAEWIADLKSPADDKVLKAIEALIELKDHTAVEHLVMVFHNPRNSPKVRLAAADALLALDSAPASVSLLGALRKSDWQVRRNAAAVLGQLDATWCIDPLIRVMKTDAHPTVRKTAAAALRRMDTPETRALFKAEEAATAAIINAPTPALTPPPEKKLAESTPAKPEEKPVAPAAKIQTATLSSTSKEESDAVLAAATAPPPPPMPAKLATGPLPPLKNEESPSSVLLDVEALPPPAWLRRKRPPTKK